MRDGNGTVEILHIFRSRELKGRTRLFARLRLPAGSSIGFHRHEGEEEIFYILSGAGEVSEGGPASPVGPGRCRAHRGRRGAFHLQHGHRAAGVPRRDPRVLRDRRGMLFFGHRRPFERLATSFRWLEQKPFPAARETSYAAGYEGRALRHHPAEGQRVRLGDSGGGAAVHGFHPRSGGGAGSVERAFRRRR